MTETSTTGNALRREDERDAAVGLEPNELTPKTPWSPGDYAPIVTGSGAVKLAASGVAPLVAAARGYESVQETQAKDFAKQWGIPDARSTRGAQFRASFRDNGDVLALPWFSADSIHRDIQAMDVTSATSLQMRPKNPRIGERGKPVKYEFLIGQDTVLDFHPATTQAWANSAPTTMLAEGLLKGDSALTAQMRAHVSDEELFLARNDSRLDAMRRLAALMELIPIHERVAVISLAGVGNWRSNPEWNSIKLKGRKVLIAFDGDVNDNWNVWNMAKQLFDFVEQSKKGLPHLVDLGRFPGIEGVLALEPKLGLDDFFNHVGTWLDVPGMTVDGLPARPSRIEESAVGDWRVSADGTFAEKCEARIDSQGHEAGVVWRRKVGIGGRIKFTESRRSTTDEELRTGVFGADVDEAALDSQCTVELKWMDELLGREITADITGPQKILGYAPELWERHGAHIPKPVLVNSEWPPRHGQEWLRAVKRNTPEQIEDRTTWETMGWVPVEGENAMGFIAGATVIATSDTAAAKIRPGVTSRELSGAELFGLSDVYRGSDLVDPSGDHSISNDLKQVLETLVVDSPWTTKQVAVTMLALALRPTVPMPTSCVAYFVGAAGMGKSWSAKQVMSFWQKRPGTWEKTLPGAANDTFTSTEDAVARTPIWVMDDFAPSADRRQSEATEASVSNLIRAVFNKLGKRRMNSDMTAREVPSPMAAFIVTAENDTTVQSIRERVVRVEFSGLNGAPVQKANRMAYRELTAARITAATVRMFIHRGEQMGWNAMVAELVDAQANALEQAKHIMVELGIDPREVERPSSIAADLALGLVALSMLAEHIGAAELADHFHWEDSGYAHLMTQQVASGHLNKPEMKPGEVLLDCLRSVLRQGRAHVGNFGQPYLPPVNDEARYHLNDDLGWRMDQRAGVLVPQKEKIASLSEDNDGSSVLWFNKHAAFNEAQKAFPGRIPYGATADSAWTNVWHLGLQSKKYNQPDKNTNTRQKKNLGAGESGKSNRGVPVDLTTFLGITEDATEAD